VTEISYDSHMHVELIQSTGTDKTIVAAARVSTVGELSADSFAADAPDQTGLINFLMKNRHGTPFEHGLFTFRVRVPIFVMRELHRHRIAFSFNEESGRYKKLDPVFFVPDVDRALIQTGKPGHYVYVPGEPDDTQFVKRSIERNSIQAWNEYNLMLDRGIAKEVARMVLPVNIYSTCYVTCNPRSLMAFLSLRTKSDEAKFPSYPMREIEQMGFQFEDHFSERYPITHEAFCKNGRVSP
jgi:thymidylate synthase (FAD)